MTPLSWSPTKRTRNKVTLRHLKARHTKAKDLVLTFDGSCQRFASARSRGALAAGCTGRGQRQARLGSCRRLGPDAAGCRGRRPGPGGRIVLGEPQPIPVGQEPPPLRPRPSPGANGRAPARHQGDQDKAKGKPARRRTGDRFAVLNAFVDFTLAGLTRNEIAVWLVLYRDTKPDGTARTSQVDMARRVGKSDRTVRRASTS